MTDDDERCFCIECGRWLFVKLIEILGNPPEKGKAVLKTNQVISLEFRLFVNTFGAQHDQA